MCETSASKRTSFLGGNGYKLHTQIAQAHVLRMSTHRIGSTRVGATTPPSSWRCHLQHEKSTCVEATDSTRIILELRLDSLLLHIGRSLYIPRPSTSRPCGRLFTSAGHHPGEDQHYRMQPKRSCRRSESEQTIGNGESHDYSAGNRC
jgi:hypothetical protein